MEQPKEEVIITHSTPKEAESDEKEENHKYVVEESLTPPLLPSMKVKSETENLNDKKTEKEVKVKKSEWDMFAEQDIFKADTNVCFISKFYYCIVFLAKYQQEKLSIIFW